ncbi:MAG: serine/threonine-protein kinase [Polyangiales bacterium]
MSSDDRASLDGRGRTAPSPLPRSVATSSIALDAAGDAAVRGEVEAKELASELSRMRFVLGIGIVLWSIVGIPNDVVVTRTFGLPYTQFLVARILSSLGLMVPYAFMFRPLGPRQLELAERIAFASAAMGLAGLNHGLQGPTTSFLSCILLTQGISRPRPFRSGLVALGTTYLCHPLGFVLTEVLTHRNADQLRDPRLVLGQLVSLLLGASTLALLVVGGDAYSRLRRSAFEQRTIGRYRLERRLAVGPGSEVWRAHHDGLGIDVALKLARPSRGAVERVERETRMLAGLSHPASVQLVDRGTTEEGIPYYVMELVEGETLASLVAREGRLSSRRVLAIGKQLAGALAEIHLRGIVHRDVKPENVLLVPVDDELADVVKLVDFGLASVIGDPVSATGEGTPRYAAPEQRSGALPDPRTDVFALGALLHLALSGPGPVEGAGSYAALARGGELSLPADVDAGLAALVARCLATDPDVRYVDAGAVADALHAPEDRST